METHVTGYRSSAHAYKILYLGFIFLPFIAGMDKFFEFLVYWPQYLSPMIAKSVNPVFFMKMVGIVEIFAATLVAIKPRIGSVIVFLWLLGIIANLLSIPGYYDIALRDFGLAMGALALALLARDYHPG